MLINIKIIKKVNIERKVFSLDQSPKAEKLALDEH